MRKIEVSIYIFVLLRLLLLVQDIIIQIPPISDIFYFVGTKIVSTRVPHERWNKYKIIQNSTTVKTNFQTTKPNIDPIDALHRTHPIPYLIVRTKCHNLHCIWQNYKFWCWHLYYLLLTRELLFDYPSNHFWICNGKPLPYTLSALPYLQSSN